MNRYLAAFCCGVVIVAASAIAQEEITIGADFGLSGDVARYGEWVSRGIRIAEAEINQQKLIEGKKIHVLFEDNQGLPALAVNAFRKLRDINRAQFVLTYQSSVALAISPLADKEHVVQMDVSAFSPLYSSPDDYTFRTGILAGELAEGIAKLMSTRFGIKQVGVFSIDNDKGQAGFDAFEVSFPGEILAHETFEASDTDFRSIILRMKLAKPQAVFISGHLKETGLLVKQAKELKLGIPLFSDVYSVEGPDFFQAAQGGGEGLMYASPRFDENLNSTANAFISKYQQEYKEMPTFMAAQAYDGLLSLAKAMALCQPLSADCVKEKLYALDFEGASGHIRFNRFGDVTSKPVELKVIHGNASSIVGVAEQGKFKIGTILPLTGPLAEYGIASKNGIELAQKQQPGQFNNVEFIYEDSLYDNKTAMLLYQKLKEIDKVNLIYLWGYGHVQAVAPVSERDGFPLIAVTAERSASANRPHVVIFNFYAEQLGEALITYLRSKGYKKLGIIKVEQAFINGIFDGIKLQLKPDESLEVVEDFQLEENSFKSSIAKIKQRNFDALGVLLAPGQISQFMKEAAALHLDLPFFGTHYFESKTEVQQSGTKILGAVFPALDVSEGFRKDYLTSYGNDSRIGFAGSAFDFAVIVGKLFGSIGANASSEQILKALSSIKAENGVTGTIGYVEEPGFGKSFHFPVVVKKVTERGFERVGM